VRVESSHKDVEQNSGEEQRLEEKPPCCGYMREEENSLQLILLLIDVEDIWLLLLYNVELGTLELLQIDVGGARGELLQQDAEIG
jgi:hypothetical protein